MNATKFSIVRRDLLVEMKGGCRQRDATGVLSPESVMLLKDCNRRVIAVLLVSAAPNNIQSAQAYHDDSIASVSSGRRFTTPAVSCQRVDEG